MDHRCEVLSTANLIQDDSPEVLVAAASQLKLRDESYCLDQQLLKSAPATERKATLRLFAEPCASYLSLSVVADYSLLHVTQQTVMESSHSNILCTILNMGSSNSSSNDLSWNNLSQIRHDMFMSAASDTSDSSATQPEADVYRAPRPQHTTSDTTPKRPLRLSNAHRRRISTASVQTVNSNRIAIRSGQLTFGSDAFAEDVDYGFRTNTTSAEYDISFRTRPENRCSCCNLRHPPYAHDDEYPEKCWDHQVCIPRGGWKRHLEQYEHATCPLPDCVRSTSEFISNEKFIKHWVTRHEEKCWYWEKKKNVFGGEKAVWLRWNGSR